MKISTEKYLIYLIFLVFSILSWLSIIHTKKILNRIQNPISLVLFTSLINVITLIIIISLEFNSSPQESIHDLLSVSSTDLLLLVAIAMIFTFGRITFSTSLKHHDPRTIKISGFMVSTFVSGGALYLLRDKTFTTSRYAGFLLMAIGGYLFIT